MYIPKKAHLFLIVVTFENAKNTYIIAKKYKGLGSSSDSKVIGNNIYKKTIYIPIRGTIANDLVDKFFFYSSTFDNYKYWYKVEKDEEIKTYLKKINIYLP